VGAAFVFTHSASFHPLGTAPMLSRDRSWDAQNEQHPPGFWSLDRRTPTGSLDLGLTVQRRGREIDFDSGLRTGFQMERLLRVPAILRGIDFRPDVIKLVGAASAPRPEMPSMSPTAGKWDSPYHRPR